MRRTLGLDRVAATRDEIAAELPGDELVSHPDSVMDRGFDVEGPTEQVWPWLVQLGKRRAGWYLSASIERFLPRSRRGLRRLDPRWQQLDVGDVIPDYGGRDETFTVAQIAPPHLLVYTSRRKQMAVSWAIQLTPLGPSSTRVHLRLRLGPVKHKRLVDTAGELFDLLTVAGLAAGLRERVVSR